MKKLTQRRNIVSRKYISPQIKMKRVLAERGFVGTTATTVTGNYSGGNTNEKYSEDGEYGW